MKSAQTILTGCGGPVPTYHAYVVGEFGPSWNNPEIKSYEDQAGWDSQRCGIPEEGIDTVFTAFCERCTRRAGIVW